MTLELTDGRTTPVHDHPPPLYEIKLAFILDHFYTICWLDLNATMSTLLWRERACLCTRLWKTGCWMHSDVQITSVGLYSHHDHRH